MEDHSYVNARIARSNFSRLINTARIENERVVITDHGEPAAAVIPIRDLRLLDLLYQMRWIDHISDKSFKDMSLEEFKEFNKILSLFGIIESDFCGIAKIFQITVLL